MKARVGCIPCFVKQGLSAVRLSTPDPAAQQRVLDLCWSLEKLDDVGKLFTLFPAA